MPREDYDIVGSYDNQRFKPINAERTVNMFEFLDPDGKRPKVLLPTSGLKDSLLTFGVAAGAGAARAAFVYKDAIYQIYGDQVIRTTGTTGNLVTGIIGSVSNTTGYAAIDANTFQVIFVDRSAGYIYDTNATTYTQITDTGFPSAPIDVCYLDGFFVVANGNTNTFQLSSFEQGMVWSGFSTTYTANVGPDTLTLASSTANFATGVPIYVTTTGTAPNPPFVGPPQLYYCINSGVPNTIQLAATYADAIAGTPINIIAIGIGTQTITVNGQVQLGSITSHPGNIVGCRTLHRRLFLFSANFTEVWENAGIGTNLPFRRNNSLLMEVGTPAVGSIAVGFDRMFFLAQDKDGLAGVMEVRGTEAIPVSNRALDFQLAQYAADPNVGISDARGILVKENGIIFYRLNFTEANHTFVLNVTFSTPDQLKWHEEEVLNGDRHPAQTHAYFDGVNYYGDYQTTLFYIVDPNYPKNLTEPIRRMRIGKQMTPPGYNRLRIDRWQLDVVQGQEQRDTIFSTFTADSASNIISPASEFDEWQTGVAVTVSTNGELPQPLLPYTTYYVIRTSIGNPPQIQLAATYADATATVPVPIVLLTDGTPDNFITMVAQRTADIQPLIYLQISKDGGQSYGFYTTASMGRIGQRTYRSVWRKLGTTPRGQGFVPKIEFFNEIPFIVLGAAWDYEVMPE